MAREYLGDTYEVSLRWLPPSGLPDNGVFHYSHNEPDYRKVLAMAKRGECHILTIDRISIYDTADRIETDREIIKA